MCARLTKADLILNQILPVLVIWFGDAVIGLRQLRMVLPINLSENEIESGSQLSIF